MSAYPSRRHVLAGLGAVCAGASAPRTQLITGVNLAGLEFKSGKIPGRLDHDFVAPTLAELDYYRERGARAVRIPFLWERLQPALNGPFDDSYARILFDLVDATHQRRMKIILDPHQYGRRRVNGASLIIGQDPGLPAASFAQFWRAVAARCRDHEHVIFALQNEPHDVDQTPLVSVSNQAITAIRATGARQLILVSGGAWSGAHSWVSSGNAVSMLTIRDPLNNYAFDVHQYLDQDSSGTHADCIVGASNRLESFTRWARTNSRRGFLGEFGASEDELCTTELDSLLAYIADNRDVWLGWTYWAGGPWWGHHYPLNLEPESLQHPSDRPQMAVLRRHFE